MDLGNVYWCSTCKKFIPIASVNLLQAGVLCPNCGHELASGRNLPDFDSAQTPRGVRFQNAGDSFVAEVSTRSALALALIPFTLVVAIVILSIFRGMHATGQFTATTVLLLTPFALAIGALVVLTAMNLAGHIVVKGNGATGSIFQGLGTIGRTWPFLWTDIHAVEETLAGRDSSRHYIALEFRGGAQPTFKFGSLLNPHRRRYVISLIRWQVMRQQNR